MFDNMDKVRKMIGLCPQHDVLFEDLTVKEHLDIFGVFKGIPNKLEREESIKELVNGVGLEAKLSTRAINLSGG
jgi:ATP-binding cassette subfamily A (ABC1) protein 3